MKTFTPELDSAVLDRLRDYARGFAGDFPQAKPARWAGVYLQGLRLNGERKSIEPLASRVRLPEGLPSKDPEQALQQCVNQSPWDEQKVLRRYRGRMTQTSASPEGSLASSTPASPRRARFALACNGNTAARWSRRPTARSRSRSTTSAPGGTTRSTCACICPRSGWATRSAWTGPACRRPNA